VAVQITKKEKKDMKKNILSKFVNHKPICRGISSNKKYQVETSDGHRYFLCIANISKYTHMEAVFKMMETAAAADIPMCRPVEFGKTLTCEGKIECYMLLGYIDGVNLKDLLPSLSINEQYSLGIQAGRILRKIHTIPSPNIDDACSTYSTRLVHMMDRVIEDLRKYNESRKYDDLEKMILFYNKNKHLMANEPQCFLHGDYHIANMMLENDEIKIVDFGDCEFGVSWYDFRQIIRNATPSPHFAKGQLHGYFAGTPAPELYPVIAFYLSIGLLKSISRSLSKEGLVEYLLRIISKSLRWIDNMQSGASDFFLLSLEAAEESMRLQSAIMELNNLYNSKSWQITRPLRKLANFVRKWFY